MTDLDARYGRTSRRGGVIGVVVGAAAIVAAAVVWFVWAKPVGGVGATLEWEDVGYQVVSDAQVDARFQVTLEPGNAARCAVEALNQSFAVVGWKVVDLPASTERLRAFSASILTTEHPVTGTVYRCWTV